MATPSSSAATADAAATPSPPPRDGWGNTYEESEKYWRRQPKHPRLHRLMENVVTGLCATTAKVFMELLTSTHVDNQSVFTDWWLKRDPATPLITVSNHVSALDDPLILVPLMSPLRLWQAEGVRWQLGAVDRCFHRPWLGAMLQYAKVLPIWRGQGMHQLGMQLAVERLNKGDWIHLFPEGTRSLDGVHMSACKPGIGKLVCDAAKTPVVLPIYHRGLEKVMGRGKALPSPGKSVHIIVGRPLHFDAMLAEHRQLGTSQEQVYAAVAERVGVALRQLEAQYEREQVERDEIHQLEQIRDMPPEVRPRPGALPLTKGASKATGYFE
jgi:monolysocardiolipin acyltransferase